MNTRTHFKRGRFLNPNGANGQPFWKVPGMVTARRVPWPPHVAVTSQHPPRPASAGDIVVTFIGHATFLIQTGAGNVLLDPVFVDRASPLQFAGPKRVRQPGVRFDDLPPIAAVLLSHNHYDHCDLKTLRALADRGPRSVVPHQSGPTVFVTLLGNGPLLRSAGVTAVEEIDWWEQATTAPVRVTATPAQHFSARTPFDRNRALWGGFVIESGETRIYFAGDSGYGPHFKDIGERFGPIDLALIPIGAYEPRWFMKDIHMNPEEAIQAHINVRSRRSVAMHFGTFQLTAEGIDEPVQALALARAAAGLAPEQFLTLEVGESVRC